MALAATDVDLAVDDFDIDEFDVVIQALDMDQLVADDHREFRGGGAAWYSAIFSDADIVSHCRHGFDSDGGAAAAGGWLLARLCDDDNCGDDDGAHEEAAGSSSPADSGVTDDGSLAAPAACDDAEAVSAYVAELERFLLEEDDGDEQAEVDQSLLGVVDDYFAGDQLLAGAVVAPAAGRAGRTDADGEEEDEEVEENGDVLAAREDEQSASRKRARNKIKGTAMLLTPWGELETMMHLAQIQVPAAPWRLFSCAACRMWPSGLMA